MMVDKVHDLGSQQCISSSKVHAYAPFKLLYTRLRNIVFLMDETYAKANTNMPCIAK